MALEDAATNPTIQVQTSSGMVTVAGLDSQIALDRYLAAKKAKKAKLRGLSFVKLIPAGPCPDNMAAGISLRNFDGGIG